MRNPQHFIAPQPRRVVAGLNSMLPESNHMTKHLRCCLCASLLILATLSSHADDWPQWLGPQRDGVWRETGIIEKFP